MNPHTPKGTSTLEVRVPIDSQIFKERLQGSKLTLLEILSFATNHYATGMQLVVIYNYLGHICNYKFGIV